MGGRGLWLAIGLLLGTLVAGCQDQDPYQKPPTPVKVKAVQSGGEERGGRYSATILPFTQVDLAFKVGGYVREILQVRGADGRLRLVQEGDRVAKGTVLARLRESDYLVKLNQAKSQLAEAQAAGAEAKSQLNEARAAFEQARLDHERARNLYEAQSLAKADYDAAKARHDMNQAAVEKAKAQLLVAEARVQAVRQQVAEADISVQDISLKAAMDSVVLKRNIEVGTLAGSGTVAFVLADVASVKVVFGVSDVVLESLKTGTALTIATEAIPDEEFRGQITRIAPSADPKIRVFEVEVTIPNPRGRLKAGMIATVVLPGAGAQAPIPSVPLSAIVRPAGTAEDYALFVVERRGEANVARIRRVKLGPVTGNTVAVTEGVAVGESVIVTGATLVTDGEPVRITP
jgi:multidrug efflux system membrane fusion protein